MTARPEGRTPRLVVGSDGKAEERALEVDREIGDRWLVTKGLVAGDRVIVDGLQRIRAGAR